MKKLLLLMICLPVMLIANAQEDKATEKKPIEQIRKYWFVMLKTGPNRSQDSVTAAKIQKEHISNIDRLYYEGKIKVAGPFGEPGEWRGIFIFDAESKEEVEKLLQTDLAISSGRLTYEIKPWYTAPVDSFKPGKPKKD